jgi:hypothetical protein
VARKKMKSMIEMLADVGQDMRDAMGDTDKYVLAPEILDEYIAPLVNSHHGRLAQARFVALYRRGNWKSQGLDVWAKAEKLSEKVSALMGDGGADLIIAVSEDVWNIIDENTRVALIDHELCHCAVGEDDKGNVAYSIVGHDVEEFFGIIRRHGDWKGGIERMLTAFEQSKQIAMFDKADGAKLEADARRGAEFAEAFPDAARQTAADHGIEGISVGRRQ